MSEYLNAVALLESGVEVDTTDFDVGPRFETIVNQILYLGIWCYSQPGVTVFSLEVREAADHAWFEDGPKLKSGSEIRYFDSFESAFANLCKITNAVIDTCSV